MRSRGTLRPRNTFSRKGMTSSGFSGPPKESTRTASWAKSGIHDYCKWVLVFASASVHDNNANRYRAAPSDPLPRPNARAAALPIVRSPTPSGLHSNSKSRRPTHILDRARSRRRRPRRERAEGARYTPRIQPGIRRRKPPARTMLKESPKEVHVWCSSCLLIHLDRRMRVTGCDGERSITLRPIHVFTAKSRQRRTGCKPLEQPWRRRTRKHSPSCSSGRQAESDRPAATPQFQEPDLHS